MIHATVMVWMLREMHRVLMMMGPIHVRGMRMDTAANTPMPIRK